MNKYFIGLVVILFLSGAVYAQNMKKMERQRERVEELEKIKLVEALDMNEETSVKFISRRKEFQERQKDLSKQREDRLNQLQDMLNDEKSEKNESGFRKLTDEVASIDKDMMKNRAEFYSSLRDILSYRQIAKMIVFERSFRREIRDLILNERKRNSH